MVAVWAQVQSGKRCLGGHYISTGHTLMDLPAWYDGDLDV
jgi:hypothetical protein